MRKILGLLMVFAFSAPLSTFAAEAEADWECLSEDKHFRFRYWPPSEEELANYLMERYDEGTEKWTLVKKGYAKLPLVSRAKPVHVTLEMLERFPFRSQLRGKK